MKEILVTIKSIIGLFIPLGWYRDGVGKLRFDFTICVGHMPLGWIMVLIAWLI